MSPADPDRVLAEWWGAVRARPEQVPEGLEWVQGRLIRWVARGPLALEGDVYVKVMGFPRSKDRLRYLLRPLPARYEARLLRRLHAAGQCVPEVRAVFAARELGLPRASMLVLRALPIRVTAPEAAAGAARVAELCAAGLYHPDLHRGNLLALEDGRVAVLDLQSARLGGRPLGRSRRRRMLAKLLADLPAGSGPDGAQAWLAALIGAGCWPGAAAQELREAAAALSRQEALGRLGRCLRESTGFEVRRGPWTFRYRRRNTDPSGGAWVEGGRELFRYWLGDRLREVFDDQEPLLWALQCPAPWRPGRYRLQLADNSGSLSSCRPVLEAAYRQYQALRRHES